MRLPVFSLKLLIVGGVTLGVAGTILAFQLVSYTTSSAAFCLSCHAAGDTRDVGQASKVHPSYDRVACVQCHAKPDQFLPEGYRGGFSANPRNISDNCRRCHTDVANKDTQEGFKFNALSIRIPHRFHLESAGASCTDCHANISHDREDKPTNRPRMDYCFTCHQGASRTCDKCHPNGIPSPTTVPQGPGQTVDVRSLFLRNCAICHGDTGDQLERANLRSADFLRQLDDHTLHQVIVEGKGAMPAVSMTQGVNLTDAEVTALAAYVRGLSHEAAPAPSAVTEGRDLYVSRCAACHGPKGDQVGNANLGSKDFLDGRSDERLRNSTVDGKGAMPPQGQGRGGQSTDAQIGSIIVYLRYLASGTPSAVPAAGPGREGKTLYAKSCAACHGDNGATLGVSNLRSKAFMNTRTDDGLFQAIAGGIGSMPPFGTAKGGALTDLQIRDVMDYVRTLAVDP